jgi:iron complex outermembrane receptor protein
MGGKQNLGLMSFHSVQFMLANSRFGVLARVARYFGAMLLMLAGSFLRSEDSRGFTKKFDLPADVAEVSLKRFGEQSGRGVVFVPAHVKGVKTNAVKGEWTPAEALEQMLVGTHLVATRDAKSGAFAVRYEALPGPPRSAPSAPKKDGTPGAKPGPLTTRAEPPVELGPFHVNTDGDVGYDGENSLAGTRQNTPLRDIASSVSVFTRQFLDDAAITDISELIAYSVNSETARQSYFNTIAVQNASQIVPGVFARGQETTLGLDFFLSITPTDPYRVARYEDNRGPNSILFGVGKPGGLLNQTSKIANLEKDSAAIRYSLGSWGRHRLELDTNKVLRRGALAAKLASVHQENGGWRAFDFQDKNRIYGSVTFRPSHTLRFTAMGETGRDVSALPPITVERDAVLAWYDNRQAFGVDAVTFAPGIAPPTVAQRALGVAMRDGTLGGANHRVTFIENSGTLFDAIGTFLSGSYDNAAVRAPDGSAGTAASGSGLRLNDPSFYQRTLNANGPGAFRVQRLKNYTIRADWLPTRNLAFNLAHNYQDSTATVYFQTVDNPELRGEPNRTLGVDGPLNPWAGRLYFDGNWRRQVHRADIRETRLSASYDLDTRSKWLGQHRLAALLSQSTQLDTMESSVLVLAGHPFDTQPSGLNNRITVRNYITEGNYSTYRVGDWRSLPSTVTFQGISYPLVFANDPGGAANNGGGYQDLRSGLAVLHSRFAGGKLVTTLGYRRDQVDGVALGYDVDPILGDVVNRNRDRGTSTQSTVRTGTTGVVYHILDWLSLVANRSSNQGAKGLASKIFPDGAPIPTHGRGEDYGFGFDLLNGRLNARIVRFSVRAELGTGIAQTVNPAALNTRVMDAFTGVLVGSNRPYSVTQWDSVYRAFTPPVNNSATFDQDASGYEARVTANLTPKWRLVANYSYTDSGRGNLGSEIVAWYGLKTAASGRLLQGVTRDASGRFVLDPRSFQSGGTVARWIELGAQAPAANPSVLTTANRQTVAQEVLSLVNSLNVAREQQEVQKRWDLRPHKISMFTAYDFKEGWPRGFTLGGGWRWLSGNIIGTDSHGNELTGRVRTAADLMLAYQWKFRHLPGRMRFQVNVSNLFNHTPILPIRYATSISAPDGFIVPGGRGVAYSRYDLTAPREIRCTTTYSF